jgi:beta-N-acetylhexosaminidase
LLTAIQTETHSLTFFFGNPYAIKNACAGKNIVACYEDDDIFQNAAVDVLQGITKPQGRLPVTVCEDFRFGSGIVRDYSLPRASTELARQLESAGIIDSIANNAIAQHATPGCVVLVAKDGNIVFQKAYGYSSYDSTERVDTTAIYDMASCTKIFATNVSVMKLVSEGKLDINKTLGDYLPWVRGTNKEHLVLKELLLHQAGLKSFIPFYAETIDKTKGGLPLYTIYSEKPVHSHSIRVAENMYMRNDWVDTIYSRILKSEVGSAGKYIYSDNDFIFMGKVVEAITGTTLDNYVQQEFYQKLRMNTSGFKPRERFVLKEIQPTENETFFRTQLIRGDVHDPGAAMFGGVAGHAGLFSTAGDLAIMAQMLLNKGTYNGMKFINPEVVDSFTVYKSEISRRSYGFDKPEKDNATRKDPYPALSVSPLTYGHTGFTGTCIWIDPVYNLVYVFLSNRVNPFGGSNGILSKLNVRSNIQESIYQAIKATEADTAAQ